MYAIRFSIDNNKQQRTGRTQYKDAALRGCLPNIYLPANKQQYYSVLHIDNNTIEPNTIQLSANMYKERNPELTKLSTRNGNTRSAHSPEPTWSCKISIIETHGYNTPVSGRAKAGKNPWATLPTATTAGSNCNTVTVDSSMTNHNAMTVNSSILDHNTTTVNIPMT